MSKLLPLTERLRNVEKFSFMQHGIISLCAEAADEIECYEGMKDGVTIRIADLEQRLAVAEARNECPECGLTPGPTAQRWCAECVGELRQRLAAANADIDRLNQMLRKTGYGQGQIDSYAAECEARELAEERLSVAEADQRRWKFVRDNATLAGDTQDGVYLWEFEALDMNPDSIEADVDASIEAEKGGRDG